MHDSGEIALRAGNECVGEMLCPGWRSALVCHDVQRGAGCRQRGDGTHKVGARFAEEPRGSGNAGRRMMRHGGVLGCKLALAIHVDRINRIVFGVPVRIGSGKDVVRRDDHELCAACGGGASNVFRASLVHCKRGCGIGFCVIDCCVCGAVYDDIGRAGGDDASTLVSVGDV